LDKNGEILVEFKKFPALALALYRVSTFFRQTSFFRKGSDLPSKGLKIRFKHPRTGSKTQVMNKHSISDLAAIGPIRLKTNQNARKIMI
jgi:hypothetical protein